MSDESLPRGGVTVRKYAAMCLALAIARGALHAALMGDMEGIQEILDITSTANVAEALGGRESDLTIIWHEHLSPEELNRIQGWG